MQHYISSVAFLAILTASIHAYLPSLFYPAFPKFLFEESRRALYLILGLISLGTGIFGAIPGNPIPTFPLVLLAAWFFARSSPWLHARIIENKHFGQMIADWVKYKRIRKKIKVRAIATMTLTMGLSALYAWSLVWTFILTCLYIMLCIFILTRKSE